MTVMKSEDTGNWKRKHKIPHCGEQTLEEAMDLSEWTQICDQTRVPLPAFLDGDDDDDDDDYVDSELPSTFPPIIY